ncbi:IS66 family transposase, partial [Limosilactobacillus reuteri]|nr:IS66 family transposase [Limosilactobacillus reuteri]MCC4343172.1 IS66 family transposase [Limosilactobacillus reuteri]MCC4353179.1 IS66 family transposase [Limosilactobacillus reuteri]MCC4355557.1 IS66 family transposase [Limosilactobacillus reuteri]
AGKTIGQIIGHQYRGIIMCDGYGGYSDRLYPQAKFGSCLLNKEQLKNSKAYRVLQLMRPIFHEEKQLTYSNHKEKL